MTGEEAQVGGGGCLGLISPTRVALLPSALRRGLLRELDALHREQG